MRVFESCSVEYGGKRHRGVRIDCPCGTIEQVPANTVSGKARGAEEREWKIHTRKFQALGWFVGIRPREDRCPTCMKRLEKPKERAMPIQPPHPIIITPTTEPKDMTREHRRIIFAKISEVYDSDKYGNGWTDKRIAEDLGCPRAWVAQVRDEMFGAEGANEDIMTAIREAEEAISKGRKLLEEVSIMKNTLESQKGLVERQLITINNLQRETAPILPAIVKLQDRLVELKKTLR
jgi:hypothetical protein